MKIKVRKEDIFNYVMYQDYMYIISDQNNYVKVGISKNPMKRLSQLQTGHPTKLQLVYTAEFECSRNQLLKIEDLVHKKIREKIKHAVGEWFEVTNDQIEEIKSIIEWCRIRYEQDTLYFKYRI